MKNIFLCLTTILSTCAFAQVNILTTNPVAEQVMLGNYNPTTYQASTIINHPDSIVDDLLANISADSLKAILFEMTAFKTRNTGSDTVSSTNGIGAARRWAYDRFKSYSARSQNRLITSYLQFDFLICGQTRHRNVISVLPGADTSKKDIIIVEAHIDSRCNTSCDTACTAQGMEDNASGTALVLELARVMSKYTFNHTVVFMLTIGEEQGLHGANAFATYAQQKGIKIKAVQNNDVIGGIICGQTSSPPSCPGLNDVDSTHVRLFSYGGFNSSHKNFARFIKLEYQEEMKPKSTVPMDLWLMTPEDRTGRGGDHIPFRQKGYIAMRFTSANEHGNASAGVGYTDRQHTSDDILGVDTDNDQVIDSFYVDFNYLRRNALINATSIAMLGIGPNQPDFILTDGGIVRLAINVTQQTQYDQYRVGVRTTTNDWDSVYTINNIIDTVSIPAPGQVYVSVASVDTNGVESLFSQERTLNISKIEEVESKPKGMQLLQNKPNPFDEATIIGVWVDQPKAFKEAFVEIHDINGKLVERLPVTLNKGLNEVQYTHGYSVVGTYLYSLVVDGNVLESKYMIFAN